MIFKKIIKKFLFLSFIFIFFISFANFSQAQTATTTFTQYNNVSSFDGSAETTNIPSAGAQDGVGSIVNQLLFYGVIIITALVIFRILYGGFLKGTYDNIYDQNKGKQSIKVAGMALLILIFSYAVLSFINPRLTGWTLAASSLKVSTGSSDTSTGLGSGTSAEACKIDSSYTSKSTQDEIKYDEQRNNWSPNIYGDQKQILTIGWGFNLQQTGAKDTMLAANLSTDKVNGLLTCVNSRNTNCGTTITQADADALFNISYNRAVQSATDWANQVPSTQFNSLPENIQKVLINMSYNMGSMSTFTQSGDTRQGLVQIMTTNTQTGKDTGISLMAKGIQEAKYCSDVQDRCGRMIGLIYNAYGGACPVINSISQTTVGLGSLFGQQAVPLSSEDTAKDILNLYQQNKIQFGCLIESNPTCSNPNQSEALHELQQVSEGNLVVGNCSASSISQTPKAIDPKILNFLDILGKTGTYQINAIANGCHTPTSLHYSGKAVDLQCIWDNKSMTGESTPNSEMLAAAKSAGIAFYSGETCANSFHHWHFSTTGS